MEVFMRTLWHIFQYAVGIVLLISVLNWQLGNPLGWPWFYLGWF